MGDTTALRLTLNIPEPKFRPGNPVDFSYLNLPPAGYANRPEIDVPAADTLELMNGMIRVLDDEGRAVGPWDPKLSPEVLRRGLRNMLLTRAYDERLQKVQRQGKISFYVRSLGEEAIGVAQGMALHYDDMCFPAYRQQGLLITRNWSMVDMMCQVYNNRQDRGRGRQLPVFYSSKEASFFTISGNVGTQFCQAVGWAMAACYKNDSRIAAAWIGDGSSAEGDFHYALTFAAVYRAPVLLNLVNNQWAISSFNGFAGAEGATFASRAYGYGLPGLRVDANDFLAVYAATQWAAERARQNLGATLLELFTYRAGPHSTSDDPTKYRSFQEPACWPLGDPINRLRQHLTFIGEWSDERHQEMVEETTHTVREASREAESHGTLTGGCHHSPSSMFEDVFEEMPWHLRRQRQELGY